MKNDPDIEKTSAPQPVFLRLQHSGKKVKMMIRGVILEEKEAEQHECKSDLVKLERSGASCARGKVRKDILKVLSYHSSVGGYLVAQLLVWFPNHHAASKSDGDPVYEFKLQLFKV